MKNKKKNLTSIDVKDPIFVGKKKDALLSFLYQYDDDSMDSIYIKLENKSSEYIQGFANGLKENPSVRQLIISDL